jgi:hypothetical protein
MKSLRWVGNNFPGLLAFSLAMWALAVGDQEMARFFLLLMVLFGISRQVADLRERLESDR